MKVLRALRPTPHPAFGHLLPQGEKGFCEIVTHRLLPRWEKVGEARMRGNRPSIATPRSR